MKKSFLWGWVVLLMLSCKSENSKPPLPDSVGAINTLSVVIPDELWNGTVGDKIREHFAAPTLGLQWEEPIFSIRQMAPKIFTDFARNSRNILKIKKDTLNEISLEKDIYAKPQSVISISGKTEEDIIRLIDAKISEYIPRLKAGELEENQRRFTKSLNKETVLKDMFGISLLMPSVYKVAVQEDNFVWIRRETQRGNMSVLVYALPLQAIPSDSTRVERIIKMRDSVGEAHIPGREEGMYMITEKAYAPYVFDTIIANKQAVETRGMWEVKNFFMAGPFINYVIKDEKNNRLLVLEGFAFAPSTNKRDIMFELESILKSVKFL